MYSAAATASRRMYNATTPLRIQVCARSLYKKPNSSLKVVHVVNIIPVCHAPSNTLKFPLPQIPPPPRGCGSWWEAIAPLAP